MSKKVDAIKNAVFYAQQKPEVLAEIIAGAVTDVATVVEIAGADSIGIPESGGASNTEDYTATVFSQFGDVIAGASVTFALDEVVTGVSVSNNTVTVTDATTADSFVLKATSGTVVAKKTINLVSAN